MTHKFYHRIAKIGVAVFSVIALSAVHSAAESPTRPSHPSFPSVALDAPAKGEKAIEVLGNRLPAVARAYGLTTEELSSRFRTDRHLNVDRKGRLFFADDFGLPHGTTSAATETTSAAAAISLDQAFLLHSRPGATRTLYLDLDGHSLSGTAWNAGYNAGNPISCPPWDIDGNPASFSDAERTAVIKIWQRVAEDFAPFDVDVTTQYPGEAALTRSSSLDLNFGVRVLISPISSYFGNYGGIAYIGVFDDVGDYYKPPLVFPEKLGNNEKNIAEACSHEAGHNLGLQHDGTTTGSAYYQGHGSGEVAWAPIMGVGYYRNLTQWSKGQYANANNTQDDLTVITSYGLGFRGDDYGNSAASAAYFPAGTTLNASGIVERNTDVDVFAFNTGAGTITLNITPSEVGANLDVLALLYNSNGSLVVSNNPATQLAAGISTSVAAGTYFLHVRGTGYGDLLTTGYSNYASLGQYTVTGSVIDPSGQVAPVANATANPTSGNAPLSVTLDGSQSFDQDGSIVSYAWNFGDGQSGSGMSVSHVYQTAGNYTATLTVTDNNGLTGTDTVSISAVTPNVAPVAVISVTPTNGVAPLAVSFNGTGSYDSDGSIVSYAWNFGDGSTGSGSTAQRTYANPGTYTATLTVTDNQGATRTTSKLITVQASPASVMHVASIQWVVESVPGGKRVRATVKIVNPNNSAVSGATVSGSWSGLISGTSAGTTDANGNATLLSGKFKKSGTVTFRVTAASKSGFTYDSSQNAITQVSIAATSTR